MSKASENPGLIAHTPLVRIQYLDGLRGIAISFVILYHAYSRWPGIVPYGSEFAQFPLFAHGNLGVQLFFMISGFVIFMSLEKSRNFHSFMIKRWIRLFPAMLVISMFVFLTAPLFFERPAGLPRPRDLLPGLTFIEPYWWQTILGRPQADLEGAFWSLYVEIKLYVVAGIFYFLVGGQRMIWVLVCLFLVAAGTLFFHHDFVELNWVALRDTLYMLSGKPCGWFAAGALFYRFSNEHNKWLLFAAITIALAAAFSEGLDDYGGKHYLWERAITAAILVSVFTVSVLNKRMQQLLSNRFLLLIGFISYPLYLVHENTMISLIVKTGSVIPWMPSILIPVIPISFVTLIAWLVARYVEPPIRNRFKSWHTTLQTDGWSEAWQAKMRFLKHSVIRTRSNNP
ncbi:MAG: acyltransferase [Xanthomonadales bacterium]|nr:acyltransferase [Xanthomonadales bacterium]